MLKKLKLVEKNLSPGLRKIISNVGWLSAERFLRMILSFSVGVYVIRYLGAENFGMLSYCISFVALFATISKLGLDQIVVRSLVKEKDLTAEILGTAFVLKLLGSLFTIALVGITIWRTNYDFQIRQITIIIALGLIFSSFDILDLWFQSQVLSKSVVLVRSAQFIISSIAKLVFIFFRLPLIFFVCLLLADSVIRAIGMVIVYQQQNHSFLFWKVKKDIAVNLLQDSWPLILSGVMVTIYLKIDQVMLGNMSNSQEVGNYAAAVKFSELWYFVPIVICSSVFPAIIKAKQKSELEYYQKLQYLYDLVAWLFFMIAIPMTLVSNYLTTTLLGAEYSRAGLILSIHIWSGIFIFFGLVRNKWLMAENFTKLDFYTRVLGALCNVWLNLILIPRYGGVGAALATLTSYALYAYLSCLIFPSLFSTWIMMNKALLIPVRIKQNKKYIASLVKYIS